MVYWEVVAVSYGVIIWTQEEKGFVCFEWVCLNWDWGKGWIGFGLKEVMGWGYVWVFGWNTVGLMSAVKFLRSIWECECGMEIGCVLDQFFGMRWSDTTVTKHYYIVIYMGDGEGSMFGWCVVGVWLLWCFWGGGISECVFDGCSPCFLIKTTCALNKLGILPRRSLAWFVLLCLWFWWCFTLWHWWFLLWLLWLCFDSWCAKFG